MQTDDQDREQAVHRAGDDERDVAGDVLGELEALREYAAHFLAARLAETGLRIDQAVRRLVARCIAWMLVTLLAACFVVCVARGVNGAMTIVAGREWLGQLLTGAFGLAAIAASLRIAEWRAARARRLRSVDKFEERRARQRERVGRDIDEPRAAA